MDARIAQDGLEVVANPRGGQASSRWLGGQRGIAGAERAWAWCRRARLSERR
jgi:hypothetical protein